MPKGKIKEDQIVDEMFGNSQHCTELMHPIDPRSSKHARFAQSFRVPRRTCDSHVHSQPASPGHPDPQRAREDVLRAPQHEGLRGLSDRLWSDAPRQDLSGDVDKGSKSIKSWMPSNIVVSCIWTKLHSELFSLGTNVNMTVISIGSSRRTPICSVCYICRKYEST